MRPSNKNLVMNGIVQGWLTQKEYDKANSTDYANSWKAFNGGSQKLDSLVLDESAFEVLSGLKCLFGAFACEYKNGSKGASLIWKEDGYIYSVKMRDYGALEAHRLDDDGNDIVIDNDDTSSSVLAELLAIENGSGGGSSIDPTQKQTFSGGVEITDKPLDVESEATFGSNVEVDGKLTLNTLGDIVAKDGGVLPSISIVRH